MWWCTVSMWMLIIVIFFFYIRRGQARTQAPTTRNCTVELPTLVVIAGVSPGVVQCKSLTLEEAPWWSGLLPRQVSMPHKCFSVGRLINLLPYLRYIYFDCWWWAALSSSATPRQPAVRAMVNHRSLNQMPKIRLIYEQDYACVPDIKLIRTDTTLDLSH